MMLPRVIPLVGVLAAVFALVFVLSIGASDAPPVVDDCEICVAIGCPNVGGLECFAQDPEEGELVCYQPESGPEGDTCADSVRFAPN